MHMRGAGALIFLALSGIVTPADGSRLAEPPAEVSVALPPGGVRAAHLTVESDKGAPVTTGPAVMRDGALVVPVHIVVDGTYLVAFHVVHVDGRVEAGVTRFGVGVVPSGDPVGHNHSGDPVNLALTAVAALLVVASLYVLLSRPRPGEVKPSSRR